MTTTSRKKPNPVLLFVRRYSLATMGGVIVIIFILTGIMAPLIAPYDPTQISVRDSLAPPGEKYLLGADSRGRDMLSRIIFGARVSLSVSLTAIGIGGAIGVVLGLLAGWYHRLEMPIMRLMDVMLSFPGIIVALTIIAILGPGLQNVIFAIAIYQVPQFARLAQSLCLAVKATVYVDAAISVGTPDRRILARYVLPNILAPILIQVSLLIPAAIMTAAGLSFLGLGITPPTPEWGAMLQDSVAAARNSAPHVAIYPGIALMLVVLGFNVLGDGLRDALDPRVSRR